MYREGRQRKTFSLTQCSEAVTLEILAQMPSLKDRITFLTLNSELASLRDNESIKQIIRETPSVSEPSIIILFEDTSSFRSLFSSPQKPLPLTALKAWKLDLNSSVLSSNSQDESILSAAVITKNIHIDAKTSFFASNLIFINQSGSIQILPVQFGKLPHKAYNLLHRWTDSIILPPPKEIFTSLHSCGAICFAIHKNRSIWSFGMDGEGRYQTSTAFSVNPFFGKKGIARTSHGDSYVRDIVCHNEFFLFICENGAAFVMGSLRPFVALTIGLPNDGVVELTDSSIFGPCFIDELCGTISDQSDFGLFASPLAKFIPSMFSFIDESGVAYVKLIAQENTEQATFLTAVSPTFFGGAKIVEMFRGVRDCYLTDNHMLYVTDICLDAQLFKQSLQKPVSLLNLSQIGPEPRLLWADQPFVTVLTRDQQLVMVELSRHSSIDKPVEPHVTNITPSLSHLVGDQSGRRHLFAHQYGKSGPVHWLTFE
ncbi:hypothetical protein BLNAU_3611 [Blattamonas nauphoetae]|uniref:Uncharacterized protein n=1 Tax=Blattamonas nauphoetae TaxID=2049346 RepID=A0ABQ9YD15_9EUKA|nr:hypothetical protein BLNAU_3611 [Blattamonas nauphoetae]